MAERHLALDTALSDVMLRAELRSSQRSEAHAGRARPSLFATVEVAKISRTINIFSKQTQSTGF